MKNLLLPGLCILLLSCNETNQIVDPSVTRVSVSVQNLPPLENGHYQLWGTFYNFNKQTSTTSPTHEGEYVSFGKFKMLPDGSLRSLNGATPRFGLPSGTNPQLLKDIVISVQADDLSKVSGIDNDEPGSILIGGAFRGDASAAIADLNIGYRDAFSTSFSNVTGKCTIICPSSPADSNSGVWFLEQSSPLVPGLRNLAMLPSGWRYEGWVCRGSSMDGNLSYWSTGTFHHADTADDDGTGPNSGPGDGYETPGQDFVSGSTVFPNLLTGEFYFMVTLEPVPDNSPKPFYLGLLSTQNVSVAFQRTLTMSNIISLTAPTARVVIAR